MSKVYQGFIEHEHGFNTFFATSIAIIISAIIGNTMSSVGFFKQVNACLAILPLVAFPIIVFVAHIGESEIKTAYYKSWRDKITGKVDQRKILQRFAKQYKIADWHIKPENIEADGRWNFHADTRYMRELIDQRGLLLSNIHQDFASAVSAKNDEIITAKEAVSNANIDLINETNIKKNIEELLKSAKSYDEKYQQMCKRDAEIKKINSLEKAKNEAEHDLEKREQEKAAILKEYKNTVYRVKKIFYNRYTKYTESAVKKINRVNGLRFEVLDMVDDVCWENKSLEREK